MLNKMLRKRRRKMKNLIGYDAIDFKRSNSDAVLCKYADPIEDARYDISVADAEEIASEDPSLIFICAKPTEFLVYMDAPRHWNVAEVDVDDDLSWARNCNGVFKNLKDAEAHAARLNK
jgi:hypothetical protein